ncbi:ATP-binding protein [Streptomyces sp. SGAir0957]
MRLPIRHIAKNLLFTTHGMTWALWRVEAANFSHAPAAAKRRRLAALESLFKALTGEPMLLSLCPQVDPVTVVSAMIADVDLARSPRYEQLGHTVLDQLGEMELTGRTDWLAIPLPAPSRSAGLAEAWRAARAELSLQLGLMPAPITETEIAARVEQARRMQAQWPAGIAMRPATEAEILWIYGHSARRGLAEPLLPDGSEPALRGRGRTAASLGEFVVAEGGTDYTRRTTADNPFKRRYLQVASESGDSYQALLALSEMPEAFALPGAAYLQQLDDLAYPVDWCARLRIEPGRKAEAKTRKRIVHLRNQVAEYDGDLAGPPASIAKNTEDAEEYRDRLTASAREVEVRAMITLAVWGDTPDVAQDRAAALVSDFGSGEYTFSRPLGAQSELWQAMQPGFRTPRVTLEYAQYLLARDFAMAMPWCGSALGDDRGGLYGLQMASGGARPVLLDPARGPRDANTSACMAFLGELGAGKSVAMKSAVYNVLSRGARPGEPHSRGRAVIVDRTNEEEWVRFAKACPGTTQVIRIGQRSEVSLDPLRLFAPRGPKIAARFTESFLTLLLGTKPMELEGVALSEAVETVLQHPRPSMRALMHELTARGENDPAAHGLARKLRAVSRKDLAAVVFDENLPVVDADADAVVFAVNSLALPKKAELDSAHRIERLEFEKVLGRAVMYLIAALARDMVMANKDEFGVVVIDECWWLTSSDEGLDLVLELLRDGRKHKAAAYLGSHDADDIGPSSSEKGLIIRGLIPHKLVFRQTDRKLAARALDFIGLDPADSDLLDRVTSHLSPVNLTGAEKQARLGECLYRDLAGRIGLMKILIPADAKPAANIHSTPNAAFRGAA